LRVCFADFNWARAGKFGGLEVGMPGGLFRISFTASGKMRIRFRNCIPGPRYISFNVKRGTPPIFQVQIGEIEFGVNRFEFGIGNAEFGIKKNRRCEGGQLGGNGIGN
jgi:hypothetical protein